MSVTPTQAEEIRRRRGLCKSTKLRRLRLEKNMSQNDLAEKTGVLKSLIQSYEQETRSISGARLNILCALSEALGCKIGDLIDDEELLKKYEKTK